MSNSLTLPDLIGAPLEHQAVLDRIYSDPALSGCFCHFTQKEQAELLSFIEGNRGIRITYDPIFRKIFDPDACPERLEDGSIITIEMQKIGYDFPGERSNCYIADAIMRQYNRARSTHRKDFSYKKMAPVFLIILMEESPAAFRDVSPAYIHRRIISYDSGVNLRDLENVIYVSLDTFHKEVHNVTNELDAWLTFLSSDDPERMISLVQAYPHFNELYQDLIQFRKSPKELIFMISEALRIMDRNTERLMIDEWRQELAESKKQLQEVQQQAQQQLTERDNTIAEQKALIAELQNKLTEK